MFRIYLIIRKIVIEIFKVLFIIVFFPFLLIHDICFKIKEILNKRIVNYTTDEVFKITYKIIKKKFIRSNKLEIALMKCKKNTINTYYNGSYEDSICDFLREQKIHKWIRNYIYTLTKEQTEELNLKIYDMLKEKLTKNNSFNVVIEKNYQGQWDDKPDGYIESMIIKIRNI